MKANSKKHLDALFAQEIPYVEAAKDKTFVGRINPAYPGHVFDRPMGRSSRIYTEKMKGSLWGEPEHLTLSLLKTDIYDRRYFRRKPITVDEVMKGAFSEANRDYDDMPHTGLTRPKYGHLLETGGRFDAQAWSELYPFPCQKTAGQIIVLAEDFRGAEQPSAIHEMNRGAARVHVSKDKAAMDLTYLMSMKRGVVAIDASYKNLASPLKFRLYRHQDQGHRRYMDEKGSFIEKPEGNSGIQYHPVDPSQPVTYYNYAADAHFNRPFDPPESGSDGRFFWIYQVFPEDRTFPEGFRYVMMGMVSDFGARVSHQQLQKNLGTPQRIPRDAQGKLVFESTVGHDNEMEKMERAFTWVREADGVAGTAELAAAGTGQVRLYVAVVTVNENEEYMEEAKRQLLEAERLDFEGLYGENRDWYDHLYTRRENGRILVGDPKERSKEAWDILFKDTYLSWSYGHGGYCFPDPDHLEGSASYAAFDIDTQSWHSLPCYNELFTEGKWFARNQYEIMYMWSKLVCRWKDALKQKARDIYDLPGLTMGHGYLPPGEPDPWYIENQTLDFCVEVPGQVMKVIWNLWDYTGDEVFLRETAYPLLRELAIFYEAFARRGWDGQYYHLAPAVETESYGISYQLKFARDTTGAITIFRKILNLAQEAAEILGVDEDLLPGWNEVAKNLPPYPTFMVGTGPILAGNPGAMPRWQAGDHEINSALYPATLADEITLDSPEEDKELIVRTADTVRYAMNDSPYILMGRFADYVPCGYNKPSVRIEDDATLAEELVRNPERLLNSRSGRIHLFPAVPAWSSIAYKNMLARGGFEISAAKEENGVTAVTVTARRNGHCELMNPWAGQKVQVTDLAVGKAVLHRVDNSNGECIVFDVEKGCTYSIDLYE